MFMHGRNRITIDPRIPTISRRSTSGFHRRAVKCPANRMMGELHPSKNRSGGGLAYE